MLDDCVEVVAVNLYVIQTEGNGVGGCRGNPVVKAKSRDRLTHKRVSAMVKELIGTRTPGLLFQTCTGAQLLQSNTLQDSLHPILKELEHEKGGFNIFRRFRITYLKKSDCPEALEHFWSGHAQTHVSERYTKLFQDRDYRLEWAEKIGLGFDLPAPLGKHGKLHVLARSA
jgi:hypothetical protein